MSNTTELKIQHAGQTALAAEVLKILPLIEPHFKPLHGHKITLAVGGYTKRAADAWAQFDNAVRGVSSAHVRWERHPYRVALHIKINQPDPRSKCESVNYFETSIYLGAAEHRDFAYGFNEAGVREQYEKIAATTLEGLLASQAKIAELTDQIAAVVSGVPYPFRKFIEERY